MKQVLRLLRTDSTATEHNMATNLTPAERTAIRLAKSGTDQDIARFEDDNGASLSTILDGLWDDAATRGDDVAAQRLRQAYVDLVGSTP